MAQLLKEGIRNILCETDPVFALVSQLQAFEQACGSPPNGVWMTTDHPEGIVAEAAYLGLIVRRPEGARWSVKLLSRGRAFLD